MFNEVHYRAVLKFFYFMLLDEAMALSASLKAVKIFQRKIKSRKSEKIDVLLISVMSQVLRHYRQKQKHLVLSGSPKSDFKISDVEAMTGWKEYMRSSDDMFSQTLVMRYILDYDPTIISEGLGIPVGTVYFRLREGLSGFAERQW